MALDLFAEKGVPLEKQVFTWKDLVRQPFSKLNDDAFTRVRVILMNGLLAEPLRFLHGMARLHRELQPALAEVRRVTKHQQTLVNWLNPPDQSPLETTLGFEQVAIEVTARLAQQEPDPYLAQVHRFGLLEDFDHLYRFSALYDRVDGKDANNILQSYTDILPGRPTSVEHRHPLDDLRVPYDKEKARLVSKLDAYTIMCAESQTLDYYMNVGPFFADPTARQLYGEISAIEEQHVTQYESIIDPTESAAEKWLLLEAMQVYNFYSCVAWEDNPRIKQIWQRMLDYELGQLHFAMECFKQFERRDPAEVFVERKLPEPIEFKSQRAFVRQVLKNEEDLRADGPTFVHKDQLPPNHRSTLYARQMNKDGSPSERVAAGYRYIPGTELMDPAKRPVAMQPGAQAIH